ncbi:hypothetical protein NFI96_015402 [Prochilodus magdalenae]|nr:hypothetical protein NFI96_015402 [Prochilodus magdalenae]
MTERFVVIPVGQDNGSAAEEGLSQEPSTLPVAAGGGGGEGGGGEGDLGLDEREAVPILEYSREPNKYGDDRKSSHEDSDESNVLREEDEEPPVKGIGYCMRQTLQPTQVAQVVQLIQDGTSMRAVARRFAVSVSVVSRAWRRYQETGQYTRRPGGGRRRATTQQQDGYLRLCARRNRKEHCQSPAK